MTTQPVDESVDHEPIITEIRSLMGALPEDVRLQLALDLHTECDPPRISWDSLATVVGLIVVGSLLVTQFGLGLETQGFVIGAIAIQSAEGLWHFIRTVRWVFGYRRFVARRSA